MKAAIALAESDLVPDALVRAGIRALLRRRLAHCAAARADGTEARFLASLASAPVAPVPEKANQQHYEVPPAFFKLALGPRLKYSSCLYAPEPVTLAVAEEAMLSLVNERARLADGQRVLELGCGWGSLLLWAAERYPASRFTGVSNSAPQREFILGRARERGLTNVTVLTADMNVFEAGARFDRVVSVEMFEHMRNHPALLARVASWLEPGGRLFLHVFSHKDYCYPFEDEGDDDWMARHFFSGGLMPSHGLLPSLSRPDLKLAGDWFLPGTHYGRTSEDWLANVDARRGEVLEVLRGAYGADAPVWLARWRLFFMACAELFNYRGGSEWGVSHYVFDKAPG